jgi:hypothetical protein
MAGRLDPAYDDYDLLDPRLLASARAMLGQSQPADLGNPDEPGSEAFQRRMERSMPMATPARYATFEQTQADPQAREANEALSAREVARVEAELPRQPPPPIAQKPLDPEFEARIDELFRKRYGSQPGLNGKPAAALAQMATGAALPQPPPAPAPEPEMGPFASGMRALGKGIYENVLAPVGRFLGSSDPNYMGEPAPAQAPAQTPPPPAPPPAAPPVRAPGATPPRPARRPAPARIDPSTIPLEPPPGGYPDQPAIAKPAPAPASTPPPAPAAPSEALDDATLMARAQEAVRNNTLLANLARAGGMAIGRGNDPAYRALEQQAGAPLEEFGQRDALRQRELAAARAMAAGKSAQDFQRELKQMDITGRVAAAKARGGGRGGLTPYQMLMQADREDRRLEGDIQKASKDYEEVAGWEDAVKTLEEAIAKGDPAGVGRISGRLSNWGIGSDEGLRNRQAMATLGNAVLRARAGQAVTPSEAERVAIETGMQPGATEEQFDLGARATIAVLRRAGASRRAKYRDPVNAEIERRGGFVPPKAGAASTGGPPSPGMVRIRDPRTGRTGWARPNAVPPGAEVISGA